MPRRGHVRAEPLIAVRDVRASSRWYQQLLGIDALPEHEHRDSYDRMLRDGHLIPSSMPGTRRVTLTWSTQTRRHLDMESCCGSRWTSSMQRSSELVHYAPKSSKSRTSTRKPGIERCGS